MHDPRRYALKLVTEMFKEVDALVMPTVAFNPIQPHRPPHDDPNPPSFESNSDTLDTDLPLLNPLGGIPGPGPVRSGQSLWRE